MVLTRSVPADATLYRVAPAYQADYAVGAALLVRVDSRRGQCSDIYKYCAITLDADGRPVVDVASAFEDMWQEVEPVE